MLYVAHAVDLFSNGWRCESIRNTLGKKDFANAVKHAALTVLAPLSLDYST